MIREASAEAGIIFDRVRLTIAYERFKDEFGDMQDELDALITFCKELKKAQ